MDPLWQFIKDGFNQLMSKFITTQDCMVTVTDTNQEEMEAKVDTITDTVQERIKFMIRACQEQIGTERKSGQKETKAMVRKDQ
jgi:hypothetical protein